MAAKPACAPSRSRRSAAAASKSLPSELERLLPRTLEAAAALPYYRARWGAKWKGIRDLHGLARLSTLDKPTAAKHQKQLISPLARRATGTVSSGTTTIHGPLLMVPASDAELEASARYAETWHDWTPPVSAAIANGLALEVRTMHHGISDGPPPHGRLRMPWTYTLTAFRQFAQLLKVKHKGKRITSLVIGMGALRPITAWLLENDLDPARFAVRLIGTNGFRASPIWRTRLAEIWNAELWDNFSLSEFPTTSLQCPDCGHHHWLTPPVLHEVLDVVSHAPIDQGLGELTLTGLYPFMQAMPLIRYRTGDLVEVGPRCRAVNARGFRPRGRLSQSELKGNRLLVSGQDVTDVLEAEPGVARHPHPIETLGLVKTRDIGAVKFQLSSGPKLEVEARFDPFLFKDEAAALAARVKRALGCKELTVTVVRPGTQTAPWSKF